MNFTSSKNKYNSIRNVVYGKNGAVATSTPIAAGAGLDILKKGGNSVDAAIATAACLTVVEPTGCGIGGDAYALVWIEKEKKLYGLNSSGFAPERMKLKEYEGMTAMPKYGFGAVTVPGIPAAWAELNRKYGKLSLLECLKPAINYARDGYAVGKTVSKLWQTAYDEYEENLVGEEYKYWFDTFGKKGRAPRAGEIFKCEEMAATLEEIGRTNSESFYRGSLADKIDEFSRRYNGFIRKSDLEKFYPQWVEPISTEYKGYNVFEIPPNGHGITVLMALNILKGFDLDNNRENLDNYHKIIESLKLAFADSKSYVTDIKEMKVKVEALLNEEYAKERRKLISSKAIEPVCGDPYSPGTVYLCSGDKEGNMVSYIQSNYTEFGSGLVVPGTGIALHNRGNNFSLDKNHVNVVKPFKKPYHTIIPGFLCKNNEAVGAFGVMGAFMQPQGQLQVLTNLIDFNMNPQEALDAPRWQWIKGKEIQVESDINEEIVEGLRQKGHEITVMDDFTNMGKGQIILKNAESGSYVCATEKRCDGYVAAW
ncbi:gamma-glutamyltransferase [Terrisporobacter muris]|uniref:Glutathione hydrolase proenzyme n=1 Tax=Terrisporobacter muris TaxID=2963284 RepID=A0A9X2MBM1_9FIRM|nr:gamma-glutamyltransferase [Terrisporobacter muris]MCR1821166.1 gamma-glutamyltransferase [Terrisporobacter muris]